MVFGGKNVADAAKLAGFAPSTGYSVAAEPEFQKLLEELGKQDNVSLAAEREETREHLTRMQMRDFTDIVEELPESEGLYGQREYRFKPLKEWPLEWRLSAEGLKRDKYGRAEFKFTSNATYLAHLINVSGWSKTSLELTGADGGPVKLIHSETSPEEAQEIYKSTLG